MRRWKAKIIAVTPIICTIVYLLIGFLTQVWHPTWAIYFLVILIPMILSDDALYSIYPVACSVIYLLVGLIFNLWHPTWIIFLTIPVYYILFGNSLKFRIKRAIKKHSVVIDEENKKE